MSHSLRTALRHRVLPVAATMTSVALLAACSGADGSAEAEGPAPHATHDIAQIGRAHV